MTRKREIGSKGMECDLGIEGGVRNVTGVLTKGSMFLVGGGPVTSVSRCQFKQTVLDKGRETHREQRQTKSD